MPDMLNDMITGLADVIAKREACTGSQFLSGEDNVERLVRKMQRSPLFKDRISDLYAENILRAAPLHDLGKLKIPESANKPRPALTPEKLRYRNGLSEHTSPNDSPWKSWGRQRPAARSMIFSMSPITLHATITSDSTAKGILSDLWGRKSLWKPGSWQSDVYEALTSTKCYKPAIPKERAIEIIREGAGTQFDPNIADLFIASLRGED